VAETEQAEDQPKPTSLKERIALLQKQQLEQAQRHADAAQKKEKPKRPPKKRTDSSQDPHDAEAGAPVLTPRGPPVETEDDDESATGVRPPRRRTDSKEETPVSGGRELFSDTNDADQSAGPETEDNEQLSHSATLPVKPPPRAEASVPQEGGESGSDAEAGEKADEEEDEDMDPEVRRRMEIRDRMAKMSGGMGMAGMFGPPGGLPGIAKKKPKPEGEAKRQTESNEAASPGAAVPVMALPGMSMPGVQKVKSPPLEEESREIGGAGAHDSASGDDSEEEPPPAAPPRRSTDAQSRRSVEAPRRRSADAPKGRKSIEAQVEGMIN
jgi:hypothetical protein